MKRCLGIAICLLMLASLAMKASANSFYSYESYDIIFGGGMTMSHSYPDVLPFDELAYDGKENQLWGWSAQGRVHGNDNTLSVSSSAEVYGLNGTDLSSLDPSTFWEMVPYSFAYITARKNFIAPFSSTTVSFDYEVFKEGTGDYAGLGFYIYGLTDPSVNYSFTPTSGSGSFNQNIDLTIGSEYGIEFYLSSENQLASWYPPFIETSSETRCSITNFQIQDPTPAPAPEPSTMLLLGLSFLGLMSIGIKKRVWKS